MTLSREEKIALKLRGIELRCRACLNWTGPRSGKDQCERGHTAGHTLRCLFENKICKDFQPDLDL